MSEDIKFNLKVGADTLNKALDSAAKKADELGGALETALGVFAGVAALKGVELIKDGFQSLAGVVFDSIEASAQQEQATKNLNTALQLTGQYSEETSKRFQDLATSIQATTTLEDDAVLGATALIQTLGKLSADGLERATKASVDLAAALGIDLESAATLVGKAATGNVTAFGRMGIEIQKGRSDAETFSNTLNQLERSFSGAAAAQAKTFGGSLTQLKNAVGEAKESLGDVVTQNPAVIASFQTIQKSVIGLTDEFKKGFSGGSTEIAEFVRLTLDSSAAIAVGLDAVGRLTGAVSDAFVASFQAAALSIQAPVSAVLKLVSILPGIGESFRQAADESIQETERLFNSVQDKFDKISTFSTRETFLSGVVDRISQARVDFDVFLKEVEAGAPKVAAVGSGGDSEVIDQQVLSQQAQLGAELVALDAQIEAERRAQDEQFRLAKIERNTVNESQFIQAELEASLARNQAAYQAELDKNALIQDAKARNLANQIAANKKILADEKATNAASIADVKNKAKLEREIEATRLQAAQGFLSAGIALAKEGSKEQRALQSAQALVSTYTAANQAYASPPGPPYTFPLVASVIASGLANVAKINSAKFENGGIVGQGATAGPDNRVATIRDGEMILNAGQQKQLFDAINGGGMGGPIIIQINGREIARAVRDEINNGFRLTA